MKAKKYKNFKVEVYTVPGKKTSTYTLTNKKTGDEIGSILWHYPTRQYCFFPQDENRLNIICIGEILSFMDELFAGRKKIGHV